MKKLTAVVGTGLAALAVGFAGVGCGSSTSTEGKATTETSTAETSTAAAESTAAAPETTTSAPTAGGQTLDEYLAANDITKTVVPLGQGPTVDLPVPAGWSKSDPTPEASYGGLVVTKPVSPNIPPRIDAHVFKLAGNVDQTQVLALASSGLKNLPGFQTLGDVTDKEFSGFKAAQSGGSYTKDGNSLLVAQKSVVIPTTGGVYVLQLTAEGLESDMGMLMDATSAIDKETKITP